MTRTAATRLDAALVALARELRSVGADTLAAEARGAVGRGDTAEGRRAAASVAHWGGHACPILIEPAAAVAAALVDTADAVGKEAL